MKISIYLLVYFLVSCDQQPTNIKQEFQSSAGAGSGDAQGGQGSSSDNDPVNLPSSPNGDDDGDEGNPTTLSTFPEFNDRAKEFCSPCHENRPGRYTFDDETYVQENSQLILDHINGETGVALMPTAGKMEQDELDLWESYLVGFIPISTFSEFNARAEENCGSCHGAASSLTYKVGDEVLLTMMAQEVSERIIGIGRVMPPSGMMISAEIDVWTAYLDTLVPEAELPAITSFAEFDLLAVGECGSCHGAASGRPYVVGNESLAQSMAQDISDRINGVGNIMPQAGKMDDNVITQWETYLDKFKSIQNFSGFDAQAQENCGSCHGESSGRTYIVGDAANLLSNSQEVINRISEVGNVMPTSGKMADVIVNNWTTYLSGLSTFADFTAFDAAATSSCGGCHQPDSGNDYEVGDETLAKSMADEIVDRLKGVGAVMPPSNPLSDEEIAKWEEFLKRP